MTTSRVCYDKPAAVQTKNEFLVATNKLLKKVIKSNSQLGIRTSE